MAKWYRHWVPIWIFQDDGFKKGYMEEFEQEAHASDGTLSLVVE